MTKSELIESLGFKLEQFPHKDIEQAVNTLLDTMIDALAQGQRIEIRGFGSFSLHERAPRMGRNPKTGEPVPLPARRVPHFKPGKALREMVNASRAVTEIIR
ncbi:integration host factor subunit beta [Sulfurivirga sp.]|uniref:integration host factor subunit beta n=1 Tax=Sulfurivirga sp. TaxID=2614236 RepID=UPI0025D1A0CD|nr:integration host factor subunit beta [Sulfurivirga sp.]